MQTEGAQYLRMLFPSDTYANPSSGRALRPQNGQCPQPSGPTKSNMAHRPKAPHASGDRQVSMPIDRRQYQEVSLLRVLRCLTSVKSALENNYTCLSRSTTIDSYQKRYAYCSVAINFESNSHIGLLRRRRMQIFVVFMGPLETKSVQRCQLERPVEITSYGQGLMSIIIDNYQSLVRAIPIDRYRKL